MGANQGGAKRNEQEAEYEEPGEKAWETRPGGTGKTKEAKAEGKHRWNSCGSEAGRDERKQTESRVREAEGKHGKPGGTEGEKPGSRKAEGQHLKSS